MARQRKCIFCGKSYQYCPNCGDDKRYPEWMFNFDTEKCRDLYEVLAGYNMEIKTVSDVKTVLDKYEVTDYSGFYPKLQEELRKFRVPTKDNTTKKDDVEKKDDVIESNKTKKNNKFNFNGRANTKE